jgi:hypothetical protein
MDSISIWGVRVRLLATFVLTFQGVPAGASVLLGCATKLSVRMYNSTASPRGTLLRARAQVSREMAHAGLDMEWLDCTMPVLHRPPHSSCEDQRDSISVEIRISPKSVPGSVQSDFSAFGFTIDRRVVVFYDKVSALAAWFGVPEPEVLALVLAHELGHALLGPGHVRGDALMMARPTPGHVRMFSAGQLRFTRKQTELIRAYLCAQAASN